ncbi:hypothetical protein MTR_4g059850 [Medicago truncatula]|uniref:Uncharacterized protein n=1 Tax=Medicago truncatula TaxID=3880 RepID=G7JPG0_MEDTR|nr:hypothetical protein MTR_4g059850 [Medicago truncatula]
MYPIKRESKPRTSPICTSHKGPAAGRAGPWGVQTAQWSWHPELNGQEKSANKVILNGIKKKLEIKKGL